MFHFQDIVQIISLCHYNPKDLQLQNLQLTAITL